MTKGSYQSTGHQRSFDLSAIGLTVLHLPQRTSKLRQLFLPCLWKLYEVFLLVQALYAELRLCLLSCVEDSPAWNSSEFLKAHLESEPAAASHDMTF
jgi:hypothetical protein